MANIVSIVINLLVFLRKGGSYPILLYDTCVVAADWRALHYFAFGLYTDSACGLIFGARQ